MIFAAVFAWRNDWRRVIQAYHSGMEAAMDAAEVTGYKNLASLY